MIKYYFILLIHDIVMESGHVFAVSEEEASQMIERDYEGKFDQYVLSEFPL